MRWVSGLSREEAVEEQLIVCSVTTIIAELNSSNIVDVDGLSARVLQRAEKRTRCGIERVDLASSKVKNPDRPAHFLFPSVISTTR